MIYLAEAHDRNRIIEIWSNAFGDDEDYIKNFLDTSGAEVFVYKENGFVLGIINLFEVSINCEKGGYIYALAVDESYRCNGVASKLLSYADKLFKDRGYSFSVVVPEPFERLENFYIKRGFDTLIPLYLTKIEKAENFKKFEVQSSGIQEFVAFRKLQKNVVAHSDRFFEYVVCDILQSGGKIFKVKTDDFDTFCVCYIQDECVIIKETLPRGQIYAVVQSLMEVTDTNKAVSISANGDLRLPYALLKSYKSMIFSDVYANLLLDSLEKRV